MTAQSFPLITHAHGDATFAWQESSPVSAGDFLRDVRCLAAQLPPGRHILNACSDRYRFAVGLAASIVSERITLLPSTQTSETIRQMQDFAPDVFCLTDNAACDLNLPKVLYPACDILPSEPAAFAVPQIPSDQTVAIVFTSGSTGLPMPHAKRWGSLVANVRAEARLCGMDDGRSHAIVGTVPAQHMYGFESTVLIAMQSGNAIVGGKSFYPVDICNAIHAVPRPRTLVSTPVHLRSVISADLPIPLVDLLVCATAPLSSDLACRLEDRFSAPLLEIYGSTETGQIAMRRSTKTPRWRLFENIALRQEQGLTWACGGHVGAPTVLNDVIEQVGPDEFLLHGRTADLINIAGKRSSLAYLNVHLNAIDGVVDAAFFMPDEVDVDGVTRLAAFVVAPGKTGSDIMKALRARLDPVFLPRPLVMVNALPRNATGKLPREALKSLLHQHQPRSIGTSS